MRNRNPIKTLVAALGCLVPSVGLLSASTVLLDFEGLPSVSGASGTPIPANAALSNQLAAASGVVFSSINGAPYVTVAGLGNGHAASGLNGIGGAAADGTISYPTGIRISFVNPTNTALYRTVGAVSIKTDLFPDTAGTVTLAAYNAGGQLVGSDTKPDTAPQTLQVSAAGIAWIELSSTQGSAAYDDLSYTIEQPRTVIDFEGLPSVSGPTGTSIPEYAQLGDQLAETHGVIFSTVGGSPYVVVAKLGLNHAASGTNAIGGANNAGRISYPSGVRIKFVNREDPRFLAVTDSVSVKMDQYVEAGDVTITAYGASGEFLGSESKPDTLGQVLQIATAGIHSVVLTSSGGSVAWDDLSFTPLRNVLSAFVEVSAVKISWATESGVKYQVQSATEPVMGEWANVGPQVTGTGEVAFVEDEVVSGGPKKFYRVSVVP
jgi:hypothetical protein